jgi:2-polyprenyl-6-methoxyphenol hydroxylase-like FAD-dependent oxidoreductase
MSQDGTQSVLIIGAGPTGMTAAIELARFGIEVRIIEKTPEPATTSRAIGVQARTLELLEQRGLAAQLVEAGHPGFAASIYGGGKRVFRLDFSHIDSRYNYLLLVSQAETERLLREALEQLGVKIERGVELIAFAQPAQGNAVTATLRHEDGSLEQVTASYLISAEGAHSLVRSSLPLQFKGKALAEQYALGDLSVDGDLAETDIHLFSSAYGFLGLFPRGHRRFRLIASNPFSQPSNDTPPTLDELQKIYDQRSPIAATFRDLSWSSWFHIHSRMVDQLQVQRIFLGGDSAHIHSPAGAQGMNTGIQDMINLGWKLALVIKGQGSARLLATYGTERLPVIRHVLTQTEALTGALGRKNPIFRTLFNHLAPLLVGNPFVQEKSAERMSQLSLDYRQSPLSVTHAHGGRLHAGDRVPDMTLQVVSREGSAEAAPHTQSLFSLLDPSLFTLLCLNIKHPVQWHEEMQAKLAPWHSLIHGHQVAPVAEQPEQKYFEDTFGLSPSIVLLRPDSSLGFMGNERCVDKLADYLCQWFPFQKNSSTGGER